MPKSFPYSNFISVCTAAGKVAPEIPGSEGNVEQVVSCTILGSYPPIFSQDIGKTHCVWLNAPLRCWPNLLCFWAWLLAVNTVKS